MKLAVDVKVKLGLIMRVIWDFDNNVFTAILAAYSDLETMTGLRCDKGSAGSRGWLTDQRCCCAGEYRS